MLIFRYYNYSAKSTIIIQDNYKIVNRAIVLLNEHFLKLFVMYDMSIIFLKKILPKDYARRQAVNYNCSRAGIPREEYEA